MSNRHQNLLFVYGTLKRTRSNGGFLDSIRSDYMADVTTAEPYPLREGDNGLPYLFDLPGEGKIVKGELFNISDEKAWKILDRFEGVPHHYVRGLIKVKDEAGNILQVQTYFISPEVTSNCRRPDNWYGPVQEEY